MRFTARGVRETERPVSFIPKGALTHHLRSKRWYCLRQPCALRGGCGFCGSLMDNATYLQSAFIVHAVIASTTAERLFGGVRLVPNLAPTACENLSPTALSQIWTASRRPFSFCEKETKTECERAVRTNGDLPFGSKGCEPRKRTIRCCGIRLSELFQYSE